MGTTLRRFALESHYSEFSDLPSVLVGSFCSHMHISALIVVNWCSSGYIRHCLLKYHGRRQDFSSPDANGGLTNTWWCWENSGFSWPLELLYKVKSESAVALAQQQTALMFPHVVAKCFSLSDSSVLSSLALWFCFVYVCFQPALFSPMRKLFAERHKHKKSGTSGGVSTQPGRRSGGYSFYIFFCI